MIKKLFNISKKDNAIVIDLGNNRCYKLSKECTEALLEEIQRIDDEILLTHGVNSPRKEMFEDFITQIEKSL